MTQNSELKTLKVIAAIPCYNTAKTIAKVVTKTKHYVDEVIVIDDGSTDKTADIARKAGAKVIKHPQNKGYGGAIQSCFAAARTHQADILVIIDGDGQHDPDDIPGLLSPIIKEEADLVIGSRFLRAPVILEQSNVIPGPYLDRGEGSQGEGTRNSKLETRNSSNVKRVPISVERRTSNVKRNSIPRYRKFGIGVITLLWNIGSKIKVSDTQSGFRAYNKLMIKDMLISENGMSSSIEILEKLRKRNPRIKEIPITCSYENNNSHLNTKAIYHGVRVAFSVIKIRFKYAFKKD